ncbi:MAG: septum formation protein Maf [Nitrospirales bacterium]|nr:MAG: septum formation protein Maf [Nitrospirales bacterium]
MAPAPLIMASTSPRRRELLTLLDIAFTIVAPTCEEIPSSAYSPSEQANVFARDKARSVSTQYPQQLVLGSDTVIEIDNTLLGKPGNLHDARDMLQQLRGRMHQVHTGVALLQHSTSLCHSFVETAHVWIKNFTDNELAQYLDTQESLGKAGAYSIQGEGVKLIETIEGDYPAIVGLPLWKTAKLLGQQGMTVPNPVEEIYRLKPYANWKDF